MVERDSSSTSTMELAWTSCSRGWGQCHPSSKSVYDTAAVIHTQPKEHPSRPTSKPETWGSHCAPCKKSYHEVHETSNGDKKFDTVLRSEYMESDDVLKNFISAGQVHQKHQGAATKEATESLATLVEGAWRSFLGNREPRFVLP